MFRRRYIYSGFDGDRLDFFCPMYAFPILHASFYNIFVYCFNSVYSCLLRKTYFIYVGSSQPILHM